MNSINLKIHNRELEFNFGLAFMGELLDETNLTIDLIVEKMERNPFKMIPTMMYQSAKFAQQRKGEVIDFDVYEMIEMLENSGGINQKAVLDFIGAFTNSLLKDVPKDENVTPDKSKKK